VVVRQAVTPGRERTGQVGRKQRERNLLSGRMLAAETPPHFQHALWASDFLNWVAEGWCWRVKGTGMLEIAAAHHLPPPVGGKHGSVQLEPTSLPSLTPTL